MSMMSALPEPGSSRAQSRFNPAAVHTLGPDGPSAGTLSSSMHHGGARMEPVASSVRPWRTSTAVLRQRLARHPLSLATSAMSSDNEETPPGTVKRAFGGSDMSDSDEDLSLTLSSSASKRLRRTPSTGLVRNRVADDPLSPSSVWQRGLNPATAARPVPREAFPEIAIASGSSSRAEGSQSIRSRRRDASLSLEGQLPSRPLSFAIEPSLSPNGGLQRPSLARNRTAVSPPELTPPILFEGGSDMDTDSDDALDVPSPGRIMRRLEQTVGSSNLRRRHNGPVSMPILGAASRTRVPRMPADHSIRARRADYANGSSEGSADLWPRPQRATLDPDDTAETPGERMIRYAQDREAELECLRIALRSPPRSPPLPPEAETFEQIAARFHEEMDAAPSTRMPTVPSERLRFNIDRQTPPPSTIGEVRAPSAPRLGPLASLQDFVERHDVSPSPTSGLWGEMRQDDQSGSSGSRRPGALASGRLRGPTRASNERWLRNRSHSVTPPAPRLARLGQEIGTTPMDTERQWHRARAPENVPMQFRSHFEWLHRDPQPFGGLDRPQLALQMHREAADRDMRHRQLQEDILTHRIAPWREAHIDFDDPDYDSLTDRAMMDFREAVMGVDRAERYRAHWQENDRVMHQNRIPSTSPFAFAGLPWRFNMPYNGFTDDIALDPRNYAWDSEVATYEAMLGMGEMLGEVRRRTATATEVAADAALETKMVKELALNNEMRCPICLMDYEPDDQLRVLKCKHAFHIACVDQWLVSSQNNCPTCRAPAVNVRTSPPSL